MVTIFHSEGLGACWEGFQRLAVVKTELLQVREEQQQLKKLLGQGHKILGSEPDFCRGGRALSVITGGAVFGSQRSERCLDLLGGDDPDAHSQSCAPLHTSRRH